MESSSFYSVRHNGMLSNDLGSQVTFQLKFHPEYLGAKKGDQIGVQLLLWPRGSEYSGPEQNTPMLNLVDWHRTDLDIRCVDSCLSNHVTFVYTGDPIWMAPLAR